MTESTAYQKRLMWQEIFTANTNKIRRNWMRDNEQWTWVNYVVGWYVARDSGNAKGERANHHHHKYREYAISTMVLDLRAKWCDICLHDMLMRLRVALATRPWLGAPKP